MTLEDITWTARARALGRAAKHTPDRVLHPHRRRLLRRRLRSLGLPRSVLFVCHGNICRSPYAQHVFFARLPAELQEYMYVVSAGFIGPDRPAPADGIAAAAHNGIDLRNHRSQQLSAAVVRLMDLIVVMDRDQCAEICRRFGVDKRRVVVLGDLDPEPIDTRTVRDPFRQPQEVFAETYARIDRCVESLLAIIGGEDIAPAHASAPSGRMNGFEPADRAVAARQANPSDRGRPERSGDAPAPQPV